MRRPVLVLALAAVAGGVLVSAGAASADASGTPVQFTVTGAGLSITQPSATAVIGTAATSLSGATITGSLGTTTVTDLRGTIGGWTTTVAGPSSFADSNTPADTIPVGAATIWVPSTTITPTALSAVRTDLHLAQATGVVLTSSAQTLVTATTTGSNSAVFNPGVAIAIPAGALVGTYTGTVTQTVS